MTAEQKAELDRCDREIERCSQGPCVGAAIGFLDWNAEKIRVQIEITESEKESTAIEKGGV
jgi:hypothetical protein